MKKIMSNLQGFFPESVELVIMILFNIKCQMYFSLKFWVLEDGFLAFHI